jgi:drug/metabolite transporter (DMT)-like permease
VFISLAGLWFISGMDGSEFTKGDVFAMLSALCYSVYIITLDRMGKDIDEMIITIIQLFVVSCLSIIALFLFEDFDIQPLKDIWFVILIIGIICTGIPILLQVKAQKTASTTSIGVLILGEPLFTSILAFIILKEKMSINSCIGGFMILTSLFIALIKEI